MANYRVVYEIEVEAENSFEAARTVRDWLRNPNTEWQFIVQDEDTKKVVSIDMSESREDAVLPVVKYEPLIK
jgi:hypothetical protein